MKKINWEKCYDGSDYCDVCRYVDTVKELGINKAQEMIKEIEKSKKRIARKLSS